jgi:hypothetical protein
VPGTEVKVLVKAAKQGAAKGSKGSAGVDTAPAGRRRLGRQFRIAHRVADVLVAQAVLQGAGVTALVGWHVAGYWIVTVNVDVSWQRAAENTIDERLGTAICGSGPQVETMAFSANTPGRGLNVQPSIKI